jgi:hypothetical protein
MSNRYKLIALFFMVFWTISLYGADEGSQPKTPPAPSETTPKPAPINTPEKPVQPEPAPKSTPITTETTPSLEPITPSYHVLPIFKMNDVLNVEEEQRWDGIMALHGEDLNKTYPFFKQCLQNYTEKINLITSDQLNFKSERYYSLSAIKSNMPDTGRTSTKISLEEKLLGLECKNYQVFSYEKLAPKDTPIIAADYAYVNAFNWVYFMLPDSETTLTIGASYPIKKKELGRIIFREHFNEKSCLINGNGVLEEVTDIKTDKTSARLLITLKIKQTKPDNTILTADLIGLCKIPINSEPALDLEISGPFNITQNALSPDGKKILSSADGVLKIRSKITLKK